MDARYIEFWSVIVSFSHLIVDLKMWAPCNNSTPSRKLVKARRVKREEHSTLNKDDEQIIYHARPSPEFKAMGDFESDIAWNDAWDTRKKVRIFYCSRVLRKLRRKCQCSGSC